MGCYQRDRKIGDAVRTGQQSGEDAGMRSIGDGAGGECPCEANTVLGQAIEGRCLNGLIAVAVDVVGAEGIDGDQKHVGMGHLLCAAFGA